MYRKINSLADTLARWSESSYVASWASTQVTRMIHKDIRRCISSRVLWAINLVQQKISCCQKEKNQNKNPLWSI